MSGWMNTRTWMDTSMNKPNGKRIQHWFGVSVIIYQPKKFFWWRPIWRGEFAMYHVHCGLPLISDQLIYAVFMTFTINETLDQMSLDLDLTDSGSIPWDVL